MRSEAGVGEPAGAGVGWSEGGLLLKVLGKVGEAALHQGPREGVTHRCLGAGANSASDSPGSLRWGRGCFPCDMQVLTAFLDGNFSGKTCVRRSAGSQRSEHV